MGGRGDEKGTGGGGAKWQGGGGQKGGRRLVKGQEGEEKKVGGKVWEEKCRWRRAEAGEGRERGRRMQEGDERVEGGEPEEGNERWEHDAECLGECYLFHSLLGYKCPCLPVTMVPFALLRRLTWN